MSRVFFSVLACLILSLPFGAQAESSAVVGYVTLPSTTLKLSPQSRRELRTILAKLKRTPDKKIITVKGDYAGAGNQEDYITKSSLMSETVGQYISDSLGPKHEILVAVDKFVPHKAGSNRSRVTVYLMPSGLTVEKVTHERLPISRLQYQPAPTTDVPVASTEIRAADVAPADAPIEAPAVSMQSVEPSPKVVTEEQEDYRAAEELVAKEKARSAERDRRLANPE